MRTTITIQDSLLERAKEEALRKKCKLSDVVNDALRYRLAESLEMVVEEAPLLTYGSGGVRSGVDLADSAALRQIMDERE